MRRESLLVVLSLVAAALFGCVGCSEDSNRSYSGQFSALSKGKASQFIDLAQKPDAKQHPAMELELYISSQFDSTVNQDGTIEFELRNIQMRSGDSEIFRVPGPWRLKTPNDRTNGIKSFQSDTEFTDAQKWAVRCFLSYWRERLPNSGTPEEAEFDGRNVVQYSAGMGTIVNRTWVSHEDETADLSAMPNREIVPLHIEVSGDLAYKLSEKGVVLDAEGIKKTINRLGSRVVGNSSLEIKFAHKPVTLIQRQASYLYSTPMVEPSRALVNERALQAKNLAGATLDGLLVKASKALETKDRNSVFLQLRALFFLKDDACSAAVKRIIEPPGVSLAARHLVAESLTGSGSIAAQRAFAQLLAAEKGGEMFENHLALLLPITTMEETCQSILMRSAFEASAPLNERYAAQLVVGGNIRRCLTENPDQARNFTKRLVDALSTATDNDMRLNLLYALGNAGNSHCLPTQKLYLTENSPAIRAAAVHSLRHMITDSIRQTLTEMQKSETDPGVLKEIRAVLSQ